MAGNRPLKKTQALSSATTITCLHCNQKLKTDSYYASDSIFYKTYAKIPYCKDCLDEIYQYYLYKYTKAGNAEPERKAIERICMVVDLYYSNEIFDSAIKLLESGKYTTGLISLYFRQAKMYQYRKENYDTTMVEKLKVAKDANAPISVYTEHDLKMDERIQYAEELFGTGFEKDDYIYLYTQYTDWTARHECNTKAQEENFKRICMKQLELLKASRAGADTKDLDATFLKLLESAKLQPKQNTSETVADNQTFGTLIRKWENTRPIPEPDEEFKDVDGIKQYIEVFFLGHMLKMLGIRNSYSDRYDEYMAKYTVEKPEYVDEDGAGNYYGTIFGSKDEDGD